MVETKLKSHALTMKEEMVKEANAKIAEMRYVLKNLKNSSQAAKDVQVGPKVAFKPIKQVYRPVPNRNKANLSGKMKQVVVASKEAHSRRSGSSETVGSLMCIYSTTPIVERINKIERQIIDEKLTLVNDNRNLLHKVVSMENVDSDSEVEDVVDKHAFFMASTGLKRGANSGYGTNNLLEQWKTTKQDDNYDPYDDDLYESHDMSENLQALCDDFDSMKGSGAGIGVIEKQDGSANDVVEATDRVTKSLRLASLTRGTVPTSSTSAVGRTGVTDASNSTNLTISTNAPNTSGVSKSPVKNVDEHVGNEHVINEVPASDNLVMVVPNLEGTGDKKETIRVESEWEPPRCSMCLIFGHLLNDCPKVPKRVMNGMDKGKGGSSEADDEETHYRHKGNQSTEGASHKTTPSVVIEEVEMGNKASTSGVQEEGQQMASYLASKTAGVGYGTKILLEQLRETYVNDEYDPCDDDIYEGQEISDNIQSICDN
ncbi:hypothetical protein Tco_0734305 [Tanacetum coccineum]